MNYFTTLIQIKILISIIKYFINNILYITISSFTYLTQNNININYCFIYEYFNMLISTTSLTRHKINKINRLKPPLSGPLRSGHLPRPSTFAPSETLRIYVLGLRGYTPRKQQTPVCSVAFTRQCVGVWFRRKESAPASVLKRSSRSLMKSAKVSHRDTPRKSSEFRSLLWRTCGNKVTHSQAYDALATILEWLEEQDNVTLEHLLLVKKWRDLAANRRRQSQIQTRIGSFFPRTEP